MEQIEAPVTEVVERIQPVDCKIEVTFRPLKILLDEQQKVWHLRKIIGK
jgi:hypothetical protein